MSTKTKTAPKAQTAVEVYKQMHAEAQNLREKINSGEAGTQVISNAVTEGDTARQGDVMITFIDLAKFQSMLPHGTKPFKVSPSRAMVEGLTELSQHVMAGDVTVYECATPEVKNTLAQYLTGLTPNKAEVHAALCGPIVHCHNNAELQHAKHGNFQIPDDRVVAITYQRAYAEEIRRQQD